MAAGLDMLPVLAGAGLGDGDAGVMLGRRLLAAAGSARPSRRSRRRRAAPPPPAPAGDRNCRGRRSSSDAWRR
ncbi:MAG: hypothetical protein MZW92_08060 [Comamonadaceae bacterium]|nr:hypothetical protein [Comamonadaceae bacterium]